MDINHIISLGSVAGAILSVINLTKQIVKLINSIQALINKIDEHDQLLADYGKNLEMIDQRLANLERDSVVKLSEVVM